MSKRKNPRTRGNQEPPPSKEVVPPVRSGKKWLLPLLGTICAGIVVLMVVNPFSRPTATTPDRAQQPADPPELPTTAELEQESLDVARKLVADYPDHPDPLGLMGSVHYQFDNLPEAVKCWQQSLDLNPHLAQAYLLMAELSVRKGEFEEAVQLCRKALEIDPDLPGANEQLGEALMESGRAEEGVAALQAELQERPDSAEINYMLGQAYMQLNQYEQAVRHFEKALEKMPDSSWPCYGLAKAYRKLGQDDKASGFNEEFKKRRAVEDEAGLREIEQGADMLRLTNIAANTHTSAGQMYAGQGQQRVAEEHWRRAAFLDKNNWRSRQLLADVHMRRKQWAEALEFCWQLLRINPNNADYHLRTGVALYQLGQFEEAEKTIRQVLRLAPLKVAGYHSLLQVLMHGTHNWAAAKVVAEQLVVLEPTARNYVMLSGLCRQTGDPVGARAARERAQQIDPGSM